jgi:hypothetical protein
MDEDRKIRFLIPPILFMASIFWDAWSDRSAHDLIIEVLKNPDWSKVIGLIAGAIAGGGLWYSPPAMYSAHLATSFCDCHFDGAHDTGGNPDFTK